MAEFVIEVAGKREHASTRQSVRPRGGFKFGLVARAATSNKLHHERSGFTPHTPARPDMEMEVRSELSSELTRIIECSYPASLSVSTILASPSYWPLYKTE